MLRVQRVQGSMLRVQGSMLRVQCSMLRVQGSMLRVQGSKSWPLSLSKCKCSLVLLYNAARSMVSKFKNPLGLQKNYFFTKGLNCNGILSKFSTFMGTTEGWPLRAIIACPLFFWSKNSANAMAAVLLGAFRKMVKL